MMAVIEMPRAARPNPAAIECIAQDDAQAGRAGNLCCPFHLRHSTAAWFIYFRAFLAAGGKP